MAANTYLPPEEEIRAAAELLWERTRANGGAGGGPPGIVAFTGSGVSAESGIPTFRGNEGLWEGFRAEELATPEAFQRAPERVWDWYHWRRQLVLQAKPNPGHEALARLEREGLLASLVTQNVDGLHQRAGSRQVVELHGNLHRSRCNRCNRRDPLDDQVQGGLVHCPQCGSPARPDIVWFGEMLPEDAWNTAFYASLHCSAMIVVGTSGSVYPAAGLCEVAASPRGGRPRAALVIVNPEPTALDPLADVHLRGPAGYVLPRLAEHLAAFHKAGR